MIGVGNPTGDNQGVNVRNVRFFSIDEGARISGNGWRVEDCDAVDTAWLAVDADGWSFAQIINNTGQVGGSIDLGPGTHHSVIGNFVDPGQIIGGAAHDALVALNTILFGLVNVATEGVIAFDGADRVLIFGNQLPDPNVTDGIVLANGSDAIVEGNFVGSGADKGILFDTMTQSIIVGNIIRYAGEHGVQLLDTTECSVKSNLIWNPSQNTNNTWDGVNTNGDRDTIMDNDISSDTGIVEARYAIRVEAAGNNETYIGNRAVGTYGTAAYSNAGTASVSVWPGAGAPQGDNLIG